MEPVNLVIAGNYEQFRVWQLRTALEAKYVADPQALRGHRSYRLFLVGTYYRRPPELIEEARLRASEVQYA